MSACTKHAAEPVRGYSDCPGCEVESLRQQLAAAQAEVRELQRVQSDVLANLDAPDDMDVISAAHFVAGSLSTAEEALEAAQAEARNWKRIAEDAACDPDTIRELLAERDKLAAALAEAQHGLRYAVRVWVLSDEIEWSEEKIDEVVESIIGDAKKEARND